MPDNSKKNEKELEGIRLKIMENEKSIQAQASDFYQAQKKNLNELSSDFSTYKREIDKVSENKIGSIVDRAYKFQHKVSTVTNKFYENCYKSIKTTTSLFFAIVLFILLSDAVVAILITVFSQEIGQIISPALLLLALSILLPVILTIFIIAYFYLTKDTEKSISDSIEKINQQEEIKESEIPVTNPPNITRRLSESNTSLDNVLRALRLSSEVVKESIPVVDRLYREKKFIAKWENACEEVKNALRLFRLGYEKETLELQRDPPNKARETDDEISWQNLIVQELSKKTGENEELLKILVEYYNGKNTSRTWGVIKNNNVLVRKFAHLLHSSEQITVKEISVEDLSEILNKTSEFNLIEISKDIHTYRMVKSYYNGYRKKLEENQIHILEITNPELISLIDFSKEFDANFFELLSSRLDSISELKNRKQYRKALLAILLHSDLDLKQRALSEASDDETIKVLLSYQELFRKAREEGKSFILKQLIDDTEEYSTVKEKIEKGDRTLLQMFQMYKSELQAGNWYDSPSLLLQKMLNEKMDEFNEKFTKFEKYSILKKVLEENFKKININTVEKAIDANLFSVYVILVKTESGHLLNNIDLLSGVKDDFSEKSLSELKSLEGRYDISLLAEDKPIYNFVKYSTSARVGVLERDTPFDKFVAGLKEAIKKVLGKSSEQFMGSIAILRITPSRYSFGLLSDEDLEEIQNVQTTAKLDIANIITNLAGDFVGFEEKAVVASFDADIDILEVIDKFMLLELVEREGIKIPEKDRKSLRSDVIKNKIFENLKDVQITSLKELVIAIGNKTVPLDKIKSAIKTSLSSDFSSDLQDKYTMMIINSLSAIFVLLET